MAGAAVSDSRELVLAAVRGAITGADPPPPAVARSYRRRGRRGAPGRVELLCERLRDYRAQTHVVTARGVRSAVAAALAEHGARAVVIPAGLPAAWRPAGVELVEDSGQSAPELAALDGVLTGATVAIAETGTIVLAGGPTEGRRALSLVPDLHVCVVEAAQVVELVPEAFAVLDPLVASQRRPLTFVSGPSATSDIELNRVEGVHGPRTLVVIVVERNT